MRRSLLSNQIDLEEISDDELAKIDPEKLDKYEEILKKVSEIIEDQDLILKPTSAETSIRKYFTKEKTAIAKLQNEQNDLAKFKTKYDSIDEIQQKKKEVLEEYEKAKKECLEIENKNDEISSKIENLKNSLPKDNNTNQLSETENDILECEKTMKQLENELQTIMTNKTSLETKIAEEKYKEKELQKQLENIEKESTNNDIQQIVDEIEEKRTKRMNIQKAIDSFLSDAEAKNNAKRIVLTQRKEQLSKEIEESKKKIDEIKQQTSRVSRMKEDIIRLEALINREEKKKEEPEIVIEKKEPMNKARVSRLVMLLMTDGPSKELLNSIASELEWSREQTEQMLKLSQTGKTKGIGDQWVDWLDDITKD